MDYIKIFQSEKERKAMNLFSQKKQQKKTKMVLTGILILSLFCLSMIFTAFAGPGELYQKKLESESSTSSNDAEIRIGKKLFQTEIGRTTPCNAGP